MVTTTAAAWASTLADTVGGTSLTDGWLPAVVQGATVAAVAVTVARCRQVRLAVWAAVAAWGLLAAGAALWYLNYVGASDEPGPTSMWVWVAASAAAGAVACLGWSGSRWPWRNLAVFSVSFCLLSTGLIINGWIGYLPTVGTAWDQLTSADLPDQTDLATALVKRGNDSRPEHGAVVPVSISAAASQFPHRTELLYLPPNWFGRTQAALPAVMMIGGAFQTPADWVRIGGAVYTLNAFAAAHSGNAPIAVFVDQGGSFGVDTECVNGVRGRSADHLLKDVVPFVRALPGVGTRPEQWAVAGYSAGGTCALDLAVTHPETFHAFLDIAGDAGPNAGTKSQTVARLHGGDERAWASYDPAEVMSRRITYGGLAGLIITPAAGDAANRHVAEDRALCALGRDRGMSCQVLQLPGRHDWAFAATAFTQMVPWLTAQLNRSSTAAPLGRPHTSAASATAPLTTMR